jgi:hypothetical protein
MMFAARVVSVISETFADGFPLRLIDQGCVRRRRDGRPKHAKSPALLAGLLF